MATNKRLAKYPEIKLIQDRLRGGKPSVSVILFVPSHAGEEYLKAEQHGFAHNAMELFADLYDGATRFDNLQGIYRSKTMKNKALAPDWDLPIMIQSLAEEADVLNEENLIALAEFIHNMGGVMRQRAIGLIVDNKYIDCVIHP